MTQPDPQAIAAEVRRRPARCGATRVVAVDGGAAAGKSTLSASLAAALADAAVLHTDDLLDGWADQFGYGRRLRADVLDPLARGVAGSYRRYDWVAGQFAETVTVPVPRVLVVEGVSAIAACAQWASFRILLNVPRAERERRWIARDGPLQPEWRAWLDAERSYLADPPLADLTMRS